MEPPHNTCFILGAGFSCAFSPDAPTMTDFLAIAKAKGAYRPDTDHKAVASIAEKYFGSCTRVNIEDLASFMLLDLGSDPEKEKELRNLAYDQLLQIICQTLTYLHGPAMNLDPENVFRRFGAFIARKGIPIISFNYDLAFDQLLLSTNQWSPIDGYGVRIPLAFPSGSPLDGHVIEDNERIRKTGSRFKRISNTVLIKLHGSLNWGTRYVPTASSESMVELNSAGATLEAGVPLLASFKILISGYNLASGVSVSHFWRPFIVPPSINEVPNSGSQTFLRELWYLARCVLTSMTEIHVLGYSLPPSDFEADALLREGMFARPVWGRTRRVIVVNKDPAVASRFQRYARPGIVEVEPSQHSDVANHLEALVAMDRGSPSIPSSPATLA